MKVTTLFQSIFKLHFLLRFFLLLPLLGVLGGCAFLFGPERSFQSEMDNTWDGLFVPDKDFPRVAGDKNAERPTREAVMERTPLSPRQKATRSIQLALGNELAELEEGLTEQDFQHYSQHKAKLPHISDKIYFLRLRNIRERDEYLLGRGYQNEFMQASPREFQAIREREIVVGMSKDAVVQSWGRPMRVDVAGHPRNENERWAFYDYGKMKYVFFEQGRVKGWTID